MWNKNQKGFHTILRQILDSYIQVQQNGGILNHEITLGNFTKTVNIKVPCGLILGDMQGGDKHCGTSINYSKSLNRMCRQCNVSGKESGNPFINCKRMSMSEIKQMVMKNDIQKLKLINQYNVYIAWFDVDFGGCDYGIFSAAMPVEALHSIEGGLIKDVLDILFKEDLPPRYQVKLDDLGRQLCRLDKQHYMTKGSNKTMPRLLFEDSICNLQKITSVSHVGQMLSVFCISLTIEGKEVLLNAFKEKPYEKYQKRFKDMQEIFAMLLCYWSWLKKKEYWKIHESHKRESAKLSISTMLQQLIKLWPRDKGNGWFKPKVHEQLHVPRDIERNGSPRESYGGPLEHNHLTVKDLSKRTQRNRETLDKQVAHRAHENFIIDYAYARMKNPPSTTNPNTQMNLDDIHKIQGSHGILTLKRGKRKNFTTQFSWISKGMQEKSTTHPFSTLAINCLKQYASKHIFQNNPNMDSTQMDLYTEYNRNGVIFRAHPLFKQGQPWYDWIMIRFAKEQYDRRTSYILDKDDRVYFGDKVSNQYKNHYAPGNILAFYESVKDGKSSIYAIVLCCKYQHTTSSYISTRWKIEKFGAQLSIQMIDVDSIVRHVLMIPESNDNTYYYEIWDVER